MANEKEIRQTFSKLRAVGVLKQKDLTIEDKKFDDGVAYHTVRGSLTIAVNSNEHKVKVWCADHYSGLNDSGKHKGNSSYEGIAALVDAPIGTTIDLNLRAERFNDYVNKRNVLVNADEISVSDAKICDPEAEHMYEGKVEGVIYNIRPEIVGENETGRLIVTFVGVGYGQKALPHIYYVDADNADGFEQVYSVGDCTTLDIEMVTNTYGAPKVTSTGWGKRRAEVNSGFTRNEWTIFNGDDPYDEERVDKKGNKLHIDLADIKNLMEARAIMLEQVKKEGYKGNDGVKNERKQGLKSMAKDLEFDPSANECPF